MVGTDDVELQQAREKLGLHAGIGGKVHHRIHTLRGGAEYLQVSDIERYVFLVRAKTVHRSYIRHPQAVSVPPVLAEMAANQSRRAGEQHLLSLVHAFILEVLCPSGQTGGWPVWQLWNRQTL
jgi:hypothetical protein